MEFPRITLLEKSDFFDEIDVDSYFFHSFLKVFFCTKCCYPAKKGLIENFTQSKSSFINQALSIKAWNLRLNYASQGKNQETFVSENMKLIKKFYNNISKTLFIPYPISTFVETPQQSSLYRHFFKDFRSSKSCWIRFGIRFLVICFAKLNNFELSSQINIKIKKLECLLKNLQYLIVSISAVSHNKFS